MIDTIEKPFVDYDEVIRAIPASRYPVRALTQLLQHFEPYMKIDLRFIQPSGEPLPGSNARQVVLRLSQILGSTHPAVLDASTALRAEMNR